MNRKLFTMLLVCIVGTTTLVGTAAAAPVDGGAGTSVAAAENGQNCWFHPYECMDLYSVSDDSEMLAENGQNCWFHPYECMDLYSVSESRGPVAR